MLGLIAEDGGFCPVCSLTSQLSPEPGVRAGFWEGVTQRGVHVKYSLAGWGGIWGGKVVEGRRETPYQEDRATKKFTVCSESGGTKVMG